MTLCGHTFTFLLLNMFIILLNGAVYDGLSRRQDRHLPAFLQLFRELQEKKNTGENYHYIQPYYFLPSVLVFPSINHHQNTIIQESSGQENYQEINRNLQMKKYEKLVSNEKTIHINETVDFDRSVYVRNSNVENMTDEESKLAHFDNVTERVPAKESATVIDETNTTSTEAIGIYPSAKNNSDFINTLTLTTNIIEEYGSHMDPNSYKENSEMDTLFDLNNTQTIDKNLLPPLEKPFRFTFKPNVSENHNLPLDDNRWQFSTEKKDTHAVKGFRPLAGLYYDGFLHKPLNKKNGFKPV